MSATSGLALRRRLRPPRRLSFTREGRIIVDPVGRRRLRRDQHRQQPALPAARLAAQLHHRVGHPVGDDAQAAHRRAPAAAAGVRRRAVPDGGRDQERQAEARVVLDRGRGSRRRARRSTSAATSSRSPAAKTQRTSYRHTFARRGLYTLTGYRRRDQVPVRAVPQVARRRRAARGARLSRARRRCRARRRAPTTRGDATAEPARPPRRVLRPARAPLGRRSPRRALEVDRAHRPPAGPRVRGRARAPGRDRRRQRAARRRARRGRRRRAHARRRGAGRRGRARDQRRRAASRRSYLEAGWTVELCARGATSRPAPAGCHEARIARALALLPVRLATRSRSRRCRRGSRACWSRRARSPPPGRPTATTVMDV